MRRLSPSGGALDDLSDEAKALLLGDDFTIQDEAGQDRFFVDGKAFSLGNQLSFQVWPVTSWHSSRRSC